MKLTRPQWFLVAFNALYILGFATYYISIRNFEFVWYIMVMVGFFALIASTINRSKFTPMILWALSAWGFLHMAGGGVRIGDHVLYAQHLIPLFGSGEAFVLKYDQLIHFYGFGVATFVVYHLLRPYLVPKVSRGVIYPVIVAAGMGLGALNEIVEFAAVVASPSTGVGGYFNTGIDLVFNMMGAIVAATIIHFLRKRGTIA